MQTQQHHEFSHLGKHHIFINASKAVSLTEGDTPAYCQCQLSCLHLGHTTRNTQEFIKRPLCAVIIFILQESRGE